MTVGSLMAALNESGAGGGGTLQRATSANSIRKEAHARAALLKSKRERRERETKILPLWK